MDDLARLIISFVFPSRFVARVLVGAIAFLSMWKTKLSMLLALILVLTCYAVLLIPSYDYRRLLAGMLVLCVV